MTSSSSSILKEVARLIPPLSSEMHKGQAGRVGVVGGSRDYTGAPYFSCYSAMLLGADLGHIICDPSAGNVIKTYSPDLIVHRILEEQYDATNLRKELEGLLARLHVIVIGPGLGRESYMQTAAKMAIEIAKKNKMFIVIDADGLFLIQNEPDLIQGYERAVLTPNVVEFSRLCDKMGVDQKGPKEGLAKALATALGHVTVNQKGSKDIISNGKEVLECEETGGLKRCGGQGDVLSGTTACFLGWAKSYEEGVGKDADPVAVDRMPLLAAYGASTVTRTSSKLAFEKVGRAMQTSDVLLQVGTSYSHHFGSSSKL